MPDASSANAPWPVRRGGIVAQLYEHSLGIAFLALFLVSFTLHASGSLRHYREETGLDVSLARYLVSSHFWFESFQNWQSEFLSVGSLVLFTVFLRQRGSPQSKPVAAGNWEHE